MGVAFRSPEAEVSRTPILNEAAPADCEKQEDGAERQRCLGHRLLIAPPNGSGFSCGQQRLAEAPEVDARMLPNPNRNALWAVSSRALLGGALGGGERSTRVWLLGFYGLPPSRSVPNRNHRELETFPTTAG